MQHGTSRSIVVPMVLAALAGVAHATTPLSRDLSSYIVFGLRNVGLKNITVEGACNTGVDCAHPNPNSSCGVLDLENAHYADGSQIAADRAQFNRPGASVWQLFSNGVPTPANVQVRYGTIEALAPLPILGDVDGDGAPSCSVASGQCVVDAGDLAAACGFPTPFPSCNAAAPAVVVNAGQDCVGAPDAVPGNGRCDLPAGTYGKLSVQTSGKLTFVGGGYVLCALAVSQSAEVIADAPAVLDVGGDVTLGNDATFGPAPGQECGKITVHASGPGSFTFGRQLKVNGFFCAPERLMRLGHDNDLTGRFFADSVDADDNDRAFCCASAEGGGGSCRTPGPSDPLRRDPADYFALAQRNLSMKNIQVDSACNVGVNCAAPTQNGFCGVMSMGAATFDTGSQVVSDKVFFRKPGARLWQLFRNDGSPLTDVQLLAPPETPFTPPVVPGTCDASCQFDVAALETACGFPTPFPACDSTRGIRATPLADCPPFDTVPGNQQCDLAPGAYGALWVLNDARLALGPGAYTFCNVKVGRNATIDADGTTMFVPTGGSVKAGNGSQVGRDCGDLTVLKQGLGSVSFGRHALIASRVCAPQAFVRLGHGNTIIGEFLADIITSDSNNQARCCCGSP